MKKGDIEKLCGPKMVRVAPNKSAWLPADAAGAAVSAHCLCRWSRQADGTWAPVPFPYRWARLTPELCRLLGFGGPEHTARARHDTILRLAAAGFVTVARVSPSVILIDLDSWFDHLRACMDDPFMWEKGSEARRDYERANCMGAMDNRVR